MIDLYNAQTTAIATGTILASGSYTSEAIDIHRCSGAMSIQWTTTGDGTMKIEVLSSNDNVTYLDVNTDVTTAQTKSTGTSGTNMATVTTVPCRYIKVKVTETGGAQSVIVAAKLSTF